MQQPRFFWLAIVDPAYRAPQGLLAAISSLALDVVLKLQQGSHVVLQSVLQLFAIFLAESELACLS